ncbi:MAG TPA: sulfotransferase domain-containing protein, partial [Solirubrobacterales bacterium]|nr:sulfotransferase domain-containing protein [Solirubrobacterales bacterium]
RAFPDGYVTAPPDFVGVGAQRCGTTWWFRQITLHPRVAFEEHIHRKEVHYFDSLSGVERLTPEQIERYTRYFPRPPGGQLAGEWTPRYLLYPWVARQLAQAAPSTRVLVSLRDPVERYASGVRWQSRLLRKGPAAGELTLERIVRQQRRRGFYAKQVTGLLEAFPREQVLILQYERCLTHFEDELERTFEFLGLDAALGPPQGQTTPRAPAGSGLSDDERDALARDYAADVRRLVEIAPEIDPALWPSVRDLV